MRSGFTRFVYGASVCIIPALALALMPATARAWGWNDLYNFPDGTCSWGPDNLVRASDGNYYGVCEMNSTTGAGIVYKMVVTGTQIFPSVTVSTIHTFADGSVTN